MLQHVDIFYVTAILAYKMTYTPHNIPKFSRDSSLHFRDNLIRNLFVKCLCDATGDASEGITITAKRNGKTDGRFEVIAIQESNDGRWYSALA